MEARIATASASQDGSALGAIIRELVSDRAPLDQAQAGLASLYEALFALPPEANAFAIGVGEEAVGLLRARIVEFEHADYLFRYLIWSCCWGVRKGPRGGPALSTPPPPPRPPART